jgi:hypothetical protein
LEPRTNMLIAASAITPAEIAPITNHPKRRMASPIKAASLQ